LLTYDDGGVEGTVAGDGVKEDESGEEGEQEFRSQVG
jgi:hypothetical protein